MSTLKIEMVTDIPDFHANQKWDELRTATENMNVGQVIRITFSNKGEIARAQAALHQMNEAKAKGYRFMTRSRPVDGSDEWYLFIKRTQ